MALNIKIDLENIYSIVAKDGEQRASEFDTVLTTGQNVRLGVKISHNSHPLMLNVYNLAFGPINKDGTINDKAKMSHQNHSKVFSTVLFGALSFLEEHPNDSVGIDGTNNARAYLYYRCIRNNLTYLSTIFKIFGINYYIRMLRQAEDGDYDLDVEDIIFSPRLITASESIRPQKLYNYFILKLRSNQASISSIIKK